MGLGDPDRVRGEEEQAVEYDSMGPLTGYRAWQQYNGELKSITIQTAWNGERAEHVDIGYANLPSPFKLLYQGAVGPHAAPHRGCTCGYYVLKDPESLGGMLGGANGTVLGEVELWGKVIEHASGYRAEYARIKRLFAINLTGISWIPTAAVLKNYGAQLVTDENDPVLKRIIRVLENGMPMYTFPNQIFTTSATWNAPITATQVATSLHGLSQAQQQSMTFYFPTSNTTHTTTPVPSSHTLHTNSNGTFTIRWKWEEA